MSSVVDEHFHVVDIWIILIYFSLTLLLCFESLSKFDNSSFPCNCVQMHGCKSAIEKALFFALYCQLQYECIKALPGLDEAILPLLLAENATFCHFQKRPT